MDSREVLSLRLASDGGKGSGPRLIRMVKASSALVAPALVVALSPLARRMGDVAPALLFVVAVLAATYLSGMAAGLVASAASLLGYIYFYLSPYHTWVVHGIGQIGGVFAFPLVALVSSALLGRQRREREIAGEALHGAEIRFRTLVEQVPAVIYVDALTSPRTTPIFISSQVEEVVGSTAEEWMSNPYLWRDLIYEEDRERVVEAYEQGVAREEPFTMEYRIHKPGGDTAWILETVQILRGTSGSRPLVQGLMFDITGQKLVQEELRTSYEDLRRTDAERRRLLERIVTAQEDERARIASDLHDDPVQKMTALGLRLEMLAAQLGEDEQGTMAELRELVASTLSRMRHLMFELRPLALERLGLEECLNQYLREEAPMGGFSFTVDSQLASEPPLETRVVAYRIAQEALSNASRHSKAKNLVVSLVPRDGGLFVRISDDGVGFDVERGDRDLPGHLGLVAMQERADLAGGWFRMRSTPGAGTAAEFWLPSLEPASP